jgi:ubiquinone/menaquinone biosynthesis C-methylase UbiE
MVDPGESVLNIGVGSGAFEELVHNRGAKSYSLDPVQSSIELLQEKLPFPERLKVGSCDAIPFPDCHFDVIVMSEVLEHLSDSVLEAGLQEVQRVLKPGGRFIGTVPAREDLSTGLVVCPHCAEKFHRWGHQQSFTTSSILTLLTPHFSNVQAFERYFIAWSELNIPGKVYALLKSAAFSLGFRGSNENIVFVAQR